MSSLTMNWGKIKELKERQRASVKKNKKKGNKPSYKTDTELTKIVKEVQKKATPYEKVIIGYLEVLGIKYIFQRLFKNKGVPMIVDFFLPEKNIILEIDGSQHQLNEKQVLKDSIRDGYFESLGYRNIRIENKELFKMNIFEFKKLLN